MAQLGVPACPFGMRANVHKHVGVWADRMRAGPGLLFAVAGAAARAVDYLLGFREPSQPRHRAEEDAGEYASG
jgi:hypothetical protein